MNDNLYHYILTVVFPVFCWLIFIVEEEQQQSHKHKLNNRFDRVNSCMRAVAAVGYVCACELKSNCHLPT